MWYNGPEGQNTAQEEGMRMARSAMVLVRVSCGCGFTGTLEEAKAHAQDTDHTLTVLGSVVPIEPAPKWPKARQDWRHKDESEE